jgi:hypothetical protein
MKKILATMLGFLMSSIGIVFCSIYLQYELSIVSLIIGVLGSMILTPAFTSWKDYFITFFEKNDNPVDDN